MRNACIAFVLLAAGSLAVAQATASQPVAAVPVVKSWVTYTDPNEGAFQLKMPAGWKDTGGTRRFDALQYRAWANATSPDGSTVLALGDPNEPSYATPMIGFALGSIYNATGTYYIVEPLQSAQQYAVTWGTRKLQGLCTGIKVTSSRVRPDVVQQLGTLSSSTGMSQTYGEANFTCQRNGIALSGYAFLGVAVIRTSALTALWYADSLTAFLAPTPEAGIAADLLAQMLKSLTVNPQWVARQSQTAMNVSQIATQTNAAISSGIMQGWEQRSATMDQIMEEGSRVRLGIDVYADPATGTQYTVASGHQYYWVNASGTVVGTDTATPPGPSYTRLNRVPPQ